VLQVERVLEWGRLRSDPVMQELMQLHDNDHDDEADQEQGQGTAAYLPFSYILRRAIQSYPPHPVHGSPRATSCRVLRRAQHGRVLL
jgi:hypothetical protein